MTTALQIELGKNWCNQSPLEAVEGDKRYYSIEFLGATNIALAETPLIYAYAKKRDVTASVFASGSHSASGNVLTLKPATFGAGGRYVITASVTCDSADIKVAKFEVIVQRAKAEQ